MTIDPRPAIADAEWRVSIQLEIGGEKIGVPLELRYADSFVAGHKSDSNKAKQAQSKGGQPDDFGYLISRALYERAKELKPMKRRKK